MASNDGDRNNGGSSNGSRSREERPFKDIKGLLKFCVEATKSEDAQGTRENIEPMTEERQKWLEEALTSMTISPVERMRACLALIEEAEVDTTAGTEQQVQGLTELEDWAEDLDIAGDFIKLNGLRIIPGLLSSEISELRWRCLELLANISQNNPVGQGAILQLQLMPVLVHMVGTDSNPTVKTKALYALSCLVRGNADAETALLNGEGLSTIIGCLTSDVDKLKLKATFLMSSLCSSNPAFKDQLLDKGALEQLVQLLKHEDHSPIHEQFMSALLSLVTDHTKAIAACRGDGLGLRDFLTERIQWLQGKDEFQEEREYAQQLLETLNKGSTQYTSSNPTQSKALMLA